MSLLNLQRTRFSLVPPSAFPLLTFFKLQHLLALVLALFQPLPNDLRRYLPGQPEFPFILRFLLTLPGRQRLAASILNSKLNLQRIHFRKSAARRWIFSRLLLTQIPR